MACNKGVLCCWAICTSTVLNKPLWSPLARWGWADGAVWGQGQVINQYRYFTHLIKPQTQHTSPTGAILESYQFYNQECHYYTSDESLHLTLYHLIILTWSNGHHTHTHSLPSCQRSCSDSPAVITKKNDLQAGCGLETKHICTEAQWWLLEFLSVHEKEKPSFTVQVNVTDQSVVHHQRRGEKWSLDQAKRTHMVP